MLPILIQPTKEDPILTSKKLTKSKKSTIYCKITDNILNNSFKPQFDFNSEMSNIIDKFTTNMTVQDSLDKNNEGDSASYMLINKDSMGNTFEQNHDTQEFISNNQQGLLDQYDFERDPDVDMDMSDDAFVTENEYNQISSSKVGRGFLNDWTHS